MAVEIIANGVGEEYIIDVWSKISPDPNLILKLPNSFFNNKQDFKTLLKKRKFTEKIKHNNQYGHHTHGKRYDRLSSYSI